MQDKTLSVIVIFLTMLFNVTIEAMKYNLLLEAADVQNDKGFYLQVAAFKSPFYC